MAISPLLNLKIHIHGSQQVWFLCVNKFLLNLEMKFSTRISNTKKGHPHQ